MRNLPHPLLTPEETQRLAGLEALRESYRPARVRVLFVGESAPAGGTFFYSGNSHLTRATRQAFALAGGWDWESSGEFLACFRDLGCYLEDLCPVPVNKLPSRLRARLRREAVPSLAERIRQAAPQAVISIVLPIAPLVREALALAGMADLPCYHLPHPACGHQPEYVRKLATALRELVEAGTLSARLLPLLAGGEGGGG